MRPFLTYEAGQKIGQCILVKEDSRERVNGKIRRYFMFICPLCGDNFVTQIDNVKTEYTTSCGCLAKKIWSEVHTKHGLSRTVEYRIWMGIKTRCNDKNDENYCKRGIGISPEWEHSFENFIRDMGKRPSSKHSVERINNDGNYEAANCCWATQKEQRRNKRTNVFIEYNGERKTLMDWSLAKSIPYSTLQGRIRNKWSVEEMFSISSGGKNKHKRLKK